MNVIKYIHNQAEERISTAVYNGVQTTLEKMSWKTTDSAKDFRENFLHELSKIGWSDAIRIDARSKISITSLFDSTGLCVQTGNMSRFYADLLKLETLYKKRIIRGGIYVLPTHKWAKVMGSNIACYERFIEELDIFKVTITIPLMVYGISGR